MLEFCLFYYSALELVNPLTTVTSNVTKIVNKTRESVAKKVSYEEN